MALRYCWCVVVWLSPFLPPYFHTYAKEKFCKYFGLHLLEICFLSTAKLLFVQPSPLLWEDPVPV